MDYWEGGGAKGTLAPYPLKLLPPPPPPLPTPMIQHPVKDFNQTVYFSYTSQLRGQLLSRKKRVTTSAQTNLHTCKGYCTEHRKGHFFSNIYQKRNRNKKKNRNNNITFKPLLIFPFQYIAEKKLKQEYWKGNQNKKYLCVCIPILVTTFPE